MKPTAMLPSPGAGGEAAFSFSVLSPGECGGEEMALAILKTFSLGRQAVSCEVPAYISRRALSFICFLSRPPRGRSTCTVASVTVDFSPAQAAFPGVTSADPLAGQKKGIPSSITFREQGDSSKPRGSLWGHFRAFDKLMGCVRLSKTGCGLWDLSPFCGRPWMELVMSRAGFGKSHEHSLQKGLLGDSLGGGSLHLLWPIIICKSGL